ncbi:hypothetical protein PybrP1_000185 [[Pythium] brassicae (nom. inval.)]|nr:hypothetical protein PybrP1_000185 [[Pythium] brassicae (nom. inval.)]
MEDTAERPAVPEDSERPVTPPTAESEQEDVAMQLRAWRERSGRLEALLARKSARLQELEDTEAKLKRLLAMAKRSIDNSKQDIAAKDAELDELRAQLAKRAAASHSWRPDAATRDPKRVLHKIAHGSALWCLVEYANESDVDDAQEFAWHRFASAEELRAYAARASGEPIVLPELSLTPFESERARRDLKDEIERVQEEFRRYRVRAEITRKQKDAEIRKIAETDVSSELQAARTQLRRLTKSHAEAEARELEWRRKFEKLTKDYEKLSGTMGETVVREKEALEKKASDGRSHGGHTSTTNNSSAVGPDGADLQLLRHEFAQYRKRALNAVEQKEKELSDMHAQLQHEGRGPPSNSSSSRAMSTAALRRMSSESASSLSGFEPPNATTTNEYLKNIVYKYMTADADEAGREPMEAAIATVLNFSAAEVAALQEKRKQAQSWFW